MSKSATAAAPVEPIQRMDKQKMLEPRRLSDPGFGWRSFETTVPGDTPIEHIASGQFWRLCARRLNRGDHIHWRDEFLTRFGELVVVGIDYARGDIEVRVLWTQDLEATRMPNGEALGYSVKDLGVYQGFAIVRDSDQHVMHKDIKSWDEAMRKIRVECIPLRSGPNARMM